MGAAHDGHALLLARLANITSKVLLERAERLGETLRVSFLFVVVAELNDDEVTGPQVLHHRLPTTLVAEALRAATVHREVLDADALLKVERQDLSPAAFGLRGRERFVGHRRSRSAAVSSGPAAAIGNQEAREWNPGPFGNPGSLPNCCGWSRGHCRAPCFWCPSFPIAPIEHPGREVSTPAADRHPSVPGTAFWLARPETHLCVRTNLLPSPI
jgi:hypothetical protein